MHLAEIRSIAVDPEAKGLGPGRQLVEALLDEAERFYAELLAQKGRRQAGSRVYFNAGSVMLQVVDVASMGMGVRALLDRRGDSVPRPNSLGAKAPSRWGRGGRSGE